MIDIAYGMAGRAYKKSRTRTKVYALVFCCILSGATNTLPLEGIETSDVVQAIERQSSRHGVPSELYVDNGSQLKTLELVPEKDKCSQILRFCTQNGRIQKLVIVEWCRMNPSRIVNFLQRMDPDKDYKMYLRLVHDNIRVVNCPTIKVPFLDKDQDEKLKRQLMRAEAMLENTKIEHEAYVKRAEYLFKLVSSKDKIEKTRWRENLPQLPEWKLRRKRKRELRRQREEEDSVRKRRKVSLVSSRLGSRVSPQPTSASESEKEGEDVDLDEVYPGANEKAPKCKRIFTEKPRKKKGKKSGSLNQLEGIMREVVDLDHYEYPGRTLTESGEELEARMKGRREDDDFILETQFLETL